MVAYQIYCCRFNVLYICLGWPVHRYSIASHFAWTKPKQGQKLADRNHASIILAIERELLVKVPYGVQVVACCYYRTICTTHSENGMTLEHPPCHASMTYHQHSAKHFPRLQYRYNILPCDKRSKMRRSRVIYPT